MIFLEKPFKYKPLEHEREKAANGYLMSVIVMIVGLPIPFVNLLATFVFYMGNRKNTYFVRWHCMQALFSQLAVFILNTSTIIWFVSLLIAKTGFNEFFIFYLVITILFNILEFISSIYAAINTRKGIHIELFFFGELTHNYCKPKL